MKSEPIDKESGQTLSQYISLIPDELPRDAVGLYQVVDGGRDIFYLTGSELIDFVRRGIYALLDAGAVPVRFGGGTDFEWVAQKQYGAERELVAEAIIKEWRALPDDPLVLYGKGVWFARPRKDSKHVKQD